MARRLQVAVSLIFAASLLGFLVVQRLHSFWRTHGDLLNVVIGGVVILAGLQLGVAMAASSTRPNRGS